MDKMAIGKFSTINIDFLLFQLYLKLGKAWNVYDNDNNPILKIFLKSSSLFFKEFQFADILNDSSKTNFLINKNFQYFKIISMGEEVKVLFINKLLSDLNSINKHLEKKEQNVLTLEEKEQDVKFDNFFLKTDHHHDKLSIDQFPKILIEVQKLSDWFKRNAIVKEKNNLDLLAGNQSNLQKEESSVIVKMPQKNAFLSHEFKAANISLMVKQAVVQKEEPILAVKSALTIEQNSHLPQTVNQRSSASSLIINNNSFGVVGCYEAQNKIIESKRKKMQKKKNKQQYTTKLEYFEEKQEEEKFLS